MSDGEKVRVTIGAKIGTGVLSRWNKMIAADLKPEDGPFPAQIAGMVRYLAEVIEHESGVMAVRSDSPLCGAEFMAYRPFNRDGSGDRIEGLVLRQVGWYGQTGRIYSMEDSPSATEPGSYNPVYMVVDSSEMVATDLPNAFQER